MEMDYTNSAANALELAREGAKALHSGYIGTEHLLLGLVEETEGSAGVVLREFGVSGDRLRELIGQLVSPDREILVIEKEGFTPRAEGIMQEAGEEARQTDLPRIGTEHILMALVKDAECVGARLMRTMEIDQQAVVRRLLDMMGVPEERGKDLMHSIHAGSQDEMEGDTPFLDQFSKDLTAMAREGRLDPVIGRERETERILQILCRKTKNNPCLIGEPGVGKTAIVEGLAQKICADQVPDALRGRRLVTLDMAGMVAGSKYRGEFEERMKRVLGEVMDNREVLLFIDEMHTIIGAGGAEGSLDASNIMKPFLSRGEIQVIGATTVTEYRKYVEKDAALERRFQPVLVEEPSGEETVKILEGIRPSFEQYHGISIEDEALRACVDLSKRYISDRFLPDKAIDLMDESCARMQLGLSRRRAAKEENSWQETLELQRQLEEHLISGEIDQARELREKLRQLQQVREKKEKSRARRKTSGVTANDIAATVAVWTGIPAARIALSEGRKLMNLEEELHKRVVGQEEAVSAVARAVKRARSGLKDPRRPMGSFLFLGPTGVGKTELAKALAEAVFGSEQNMIRVDMSEYMEKHSVSRLVGSPPGYVGYEEGGQLSEKVRRHPYSVVLLDEVEKAHPDVFNILLQVLDEGHMTDSQGRKVDFKNTLLIMTSNAGATRILAPKNLGFGASSDRKIEHEKMKESVMEEVRRLFRPEFLNRIDETIVFHTLSEQQIRSIVDLQFAQLKKRCEKQAKFRLRVQPEVYELIAKAGYDPKYGARPLRRAIQSRVEDPLAGYLLSGKVREGGTVTVFARENEIGFRSGRAAEK